eukprot:9749671-Alexandrium_andersonii.AAC.1
MLFHRSSRPNALLKEGDGRSPQIGGIRGESLCRFRARPSPHLLKRSSSFYAFLFMKRAR